MEAELPGMVPSFLRWSERGYRAYGPGQQLMDLVVGGHAQGAPLIPIFFGAFMVHKMKETSALVRATMQDGEDEAACVAYADDGAAFGQGCLEWVKSWTGEFAVKDNQYVDSGRTRQQCLEHFRRAGMDPSQYRITCSDWSDDWSEAAKDAARKGKGASLARGVKYLGMPKSGTGRS